VTEEEKLRRDIETLREAIRLDWADLAQLPLTPEERQGIRHNVTICVRDLADLLARLDNLDAKGA
jgi:hypothetical protein